MDRLPDLEQRWAPDSPQAGLVAAVLADDEWRPYATFILTSHGQDALRSQVLGSIANVYFLTMAEELDDDRLPLLRQALNTITDFGSYDQIGRSVMTLLPFEVPDNTNFAAEAKGWLAHIAAEVRVYAGLPQATKDGGAYAQLERAAMRVANELNYGDHEPALAAPLVEHLAAADPRALAHRIAALRHHLSASPRAPLQAIRSNFLSPVLLSIDGYYETWRKTGNGPTSEVHALIKRLLNVRGNLFTSMREILDSVDDPAAVYQQITQSLAELLAAVQHKDIEPEQPKPIRAAAQEVERPAPVAARAEPAGSVALAASAAPTPAPAEPSMSTPQPEAGIWPALPELIQDLTIEQAIEAILSIHTTSEPVFAAVRNHLTTSGQTSLSDGMIHGIEHLRNAFLEYNASLTPAHRQDAAYRAAYSLAVRVWGLDGLLPRRLPVSLGEMPSPDKYRTAFRRLCLNVLVYMAAMRGRALRVIAAELRQRAAGRAGN